MKNDVLYVDYYDYDERKDEYLARVAIATDDDAIYAEFSIVVYDDAKVDYEHNHEKPYVSDVYMSDPYFETLWADHRFKEKMTKEEAVERLGCDEAMLETALKEAADAALSGLSNDLGKLWDK